MVLSDAQLKVIISGVRSICDNLLGLIEDPVEDAAPPVGAAPIAAGVVQSSPTIPPAVAPIITSVPMAELDAEGIPWDERIHTAKKSKLKSGVWRLKPGVDALLVARVKSELTLAARGTTDPEEQHPGKPLATATMPVAAPIVPSVTIHPEDPMSWSDLLNKIVGAGKTPEEVLAACTACGVDNIGKLQDVPLLIPNVAVALGL